MENFLRQFRAAIPYVAVGVLVPGGSVLALLAWWHQRNKKQGA